MCSPRILEVEAGGSGVKLQVILDNSVRPCLKRQKRCSRNLGVTEISWRSGGGWLVDQWKAKPAVYLVLGSPALLRTVYRRADSRPSAVLGKHHCATR